MIDKRKTPIAKQGASRTLASTLDRTAVGAKPGKGITPKKLALGATGAVIPTPPKPKQPKLNALAARVAPRSVRKPGNAAVAEPIHLDRTHPVASGVSVPTPPKPGSDKLGSTSDS